jgi:predicted metal-dependent phosphoesterase TrpH
LIDLHSHTYESDGTSSPAELVQQALAAGLRILGVTDHDTFAGYDQAAPLGRAAGLEVICGIELSTKLNGGRSVHLLGYFLDHDQPTELRAVILEMQEARRDRNVRLAARLRELGFDITLEEVQAKGRGLTARPHFAQVMLEKGYVSSLQQAFDEYLDESAKGYVYRREPSLAEGIAWIRKAGGIASLAHPIRVPGDIPALMPSFCDMGLNAIEAYHSDHSPADTALYLDLASRYALMVTGGSDFHGNAKPGIFLGTGRDGNLKIPADLVKRLRAGKPVGTTL